MQLDFWKFRQHLLVFLLLPVLPVEALFCSVCAKAAGGTQVDIDKLRIVTNLQRPYCFSLEEVFCDRDHDVCLMSIQNMRDQGFWVAMGCSFRSKYPLAPEGCEESTFDRVTVTSDHETGDSHLMREQALQAVCVCSKDNCNRHLFPGSPATAVAALSPERPNSSPSPTSTTLLCVVPLLFASFLRLL